MTELRQSLRHDGDDDAEPAAAVIYRVIEQEGGGFALEVKRKRDWKLVSWFPTEQQAEGFAQVLREMQSEAADAS